MASDDDHQRLRELLPWYASGTLASDEAARLHDHLDDCASCRAELADCERLGAALQRAPADAAQAAWQPSAAQWASVIARIDAAEGAAPAMASRKAADTVPNRVARATPRREGLIARWRAWLDVSPRPLRFALAGQAALIAVLGIALAVEIVAPLQAPRYETLSSADAPPAARGPTIRLAFNDGLSERGLRELLLSVHARIIAGPSALGLYTVQLDNADAAGALARLRGHPQVRLAEPVEPPGRP